MSFIDLFKQSKVINVELFSFLIFYLGYYLPKQAICSGIDIQEEAGHKQARFGVFVAKKCLTLRGKPCRTVGFNV